jgi:hypothetical protein
MTIGKSTAKIYVEQSTGVTFDDDAGLDEAREERPRSWTSSRSRSGTSAWAARFRRACY